MGAYEYSDGTYLVAVDIEPKLCPNKLYVKKKQINLPSHTKIHTHRHMSKERGSPAIYT